MKKKLSWVVIVGIRLYQRFLSLDHGMIGKIIPMRGRTCVFYPSCSEYMILAIQRHGLVQGIAMGVKRILSCRPSRGPSVDFP